MTDMHVIPQCPQCGSSDVTRIVMGVETDPIPEAAAIAPDTAPLDHHTFSCRECAHRFTAGEAAEGRSSEDRNG
jgi:hypothetical protein